MLAGHSTGATSSRRPTRRAPRLCARRGKNSAGCSMGLRRYQYRSMREAEQKKPQLGPLIRHPEVLGAKRRASKGGGRGGRPSFEARAPRSLEFVASPSTARAPQDDGRERLLRATQGDILKLFCYEICACVLSILMVCASLAQAQEW